MKQMRMEKMQVKELVQLNRLMAIHGASKKEHLDEEDHGVAWDDVSGEFLDLKEVRKARLKELEFIEKKKVWKRMTRREAERLGYKIVKTRWIDVNKGDKDSPLHRSRLVAKEFNDGEVDGLFASTPPLEALRMLISDAGILRGSG